MKLVEWLKEQNPGAEVTDKGWVNYRCPNHEERSASFGVNLETGKGHCFGCGYNPTLPELIAKTLQVDAYQARKLANSLELGFSSSDVRTSSQHTVLPTSVTLQGKGFDYLRERGLNEATIILNRLGYDDERDAIVIPVCDAQGKIKGYSYRYLDHPHLRYKHEVKYTDFLWGYHLIKTPPRYLYVTEGVFKTAILNQVGIPSVSTFSSSLSKTQKELLRKTGSEVIFVLDNDYPGLQHGYNVVKLGYKVGLLPPEYKDPDEMFKDKGKVTIEPVEPYAFRHWYESQNPD